MFSGKCGAFIPNEPSLGQETAVADRPANTKSPLEIPLRLLILMPVYEDWASAAEVCRRIDCSFSAARPVELHVILINDGSRTPSQPAFESIQLKVIEGIAVLEL